VSKIAVVVVHGVADQEPGTTRDQVASLLVANSPKDVDYEVTTATEVSIITRPLRGGSSDGDDPGIAETLRICRECEKGEAALREDDRVYSTRVLTLNRKAKVAVEGIEANAEFDMVEMYWADQSRLANSGSRILSELFTLVFRLSRLGQDTVSSVHPRGVDPRGRPAESAQAGSAEAGYAASASAGPQRNAETKATASTAKAPSGPRSRWRWAELKRSLFLRTRWAPFAGCQRLMDRLVHWMALLVLSFALMVILMCGLAIVGSWEVQSVQTATLVVCASLAALTVLAALYQLSGDGGVVRFAPVGGAVAYIALLGWVGRFLGPAPGLGTSWFAAPELVVFTLFVTIACGLHIAILRAAHQRLGVSRPLGLVLWVVTLVVLVFTAAWDETAHTAFGLALGSAWLEALPLTDAIRDAYLLPQPAGAETGFAHLVAATIRASEVMLLVIKLSWIVVGVLLLVWFGLSVYACFASSGKYIRQGSISTGRLGLGLSMVALLLLSMLLWAALSEGVRLAAKGVDYRPVYFNAPSTESAVADAAWVELATALLDRAPVSPKAASAAIGKASEAVAEATRCRDSQKTTAGEPATGGRDGLAERVTSIDAACFMVDRYVNSTAFFSPIATWMLLLLLFFVVMFAPSVLAEFGVRLGSPYQHGKWLTYCFRWFDAVVGVLVGAAAVGALAVVVTYLGLVDWALAQIPREWAQTIIEFFDNLKAVSKELLRHVVISAAGAGTVFIVFGGFLSKYLPGLRAPLDVALDVDNYFRTWPRGKAPRAMIMSRFDALLDWLDTRYDEVVIVAHSQGTVITADLLRLRERRKPTNSKGPRKEVHLATFGSPLRQLYAARFPQFYQWVLRAKGGIGGPDLEGLGVARWVNCFCSGDYVGRWLWSNESKTASGTTGGVIRHPANDVPHELIAISLAAPPLRPYEHVDFEQVDWQRILKHPRVECCLGYGAHTRYFDLGQTRSARMIDNVIVGALAAQWQRRNGCGSA